MKYEDYDLPWIPHLHKCPYACKHCYSTGAAKCSSKPLSEFLTSMLTALKVHLQKYHDASLYRSGVNRMLILSKPQNVASD